MNKLDALKQEWKNQRFDLQLSKEELYALTQKKSISSIKWIFIFSCVEFFAYLLFPFLIPDYFEAFDYYRSIHLYEFSIIISILGYVFLSYFMIQFYLNYNKIKASDSISILIETIIKSRKSVNKYILYNLGVFIVFLGVVLINAFRYDENYIHLLNQETGGEGSIIQMVVFIIIIMILVLAVLIGFYYLIYGRYFFKLKRHIQELNQIED
jgi:small-conductance mechanosensitive channel